MNARLSGREQEEISNPRDAPGIIYVFGPFRLVPSQKMLLDGELRVPIGGRAFDLLVALVARSGELVTKRELMIRAWPRAVVEENNLKVHIAALRKALGEGPQDQRFVATVVGQGYRFVAPVERDSLPHPVFASDMLHSQSHNMAAVPIRPIGRAETISDVLQRSEHTRLLTLTGPGGIGKTTVALAVAHRVKDAGGYDVWFVNFSNLVEAKFVPQTVANATGLTVHTDDVQRALSNYLRHRNKPQLIVLDSCEHVIDTVAEIAEYIVSAVPQARVIATSREPLQATGEHIYRLEPLEYPAESSHLTANEALLYPAIELFVDRAVAARFDFVLSDENTAIVSKICRRLDGIALSLELAATRLDALSVGQLLELLDDRSTMLAQGHRTAPERQRTMLGTLDWSHQLLPERDRIVLRRLSVFPVGFSLEAAVAVVADDMISYVDVIDAVASLVGKSMLSADTGSNISRYRLLDTTRDYAKRKLAEAGETEQVLSRYAEYDDGRHARDADH